MNGYKGLADETAEALSGDWLHTGDVGRFDDEGYLYIVDRTKDMVITGGFNVFPREVEDVVAERPAIAQVGVIGTPDDVLAKIRELQEVSGGFGVVIGFVHDWASPEATSRSWDLFARYVVPEINGYVTKLRESEKYLQENRAVFDRAGQAIMAKIMENKDAAEALKVTSNPRVAAAAAQIPKGLGKQAAE